jgi:UDP-N-acetylglucosamine acyltransferase
VIHATAIVDEEATIGDNVKIGPYAVVEAGAIVGNDCELEAHALIKRGTQLGIGCSVGHFAVIGGDPQMSGFDRSLETGVRVGAGSIIRESVTIHRSASMGKSTEVGENAFLMVGCHIGHDCLVGNEVTIANAALLAGHVVMGDHVFVGGGAGFHQFARVGESVMVGGGSEVSVDVPPFLTVVGRNSTPGPNLIGLRRRGFHRNAIAEIKSLYREIFLGGENFRKTAEAILEKGGATTKEGHRFLNFFASGERGFIRSRSRLES